MTGRSGLMTPAEVSVAMHVDPRTVTRWAKEGRITFIRLPTLNGQGQRRFLRAEVEAHLAGQPLTPAQIEAAWAAHRNGGAR